MKCANPIHSVSCHVAYPLSLCCVHDTPRKTSRKNYVRLLIDNSSHPKERLKQDEQAHQSNDGSHHHPVLPRRIRLNRGTGRRRHTTHADATRDLGGGLDVIASGFTPNGEGAGLDVCRCLSVRCVCPVGCGDGDGCYDRGDGDDVNGFNCVANCCWDLRGLV